MEIERKWLIKPEWNTIMMINHPSIEPIRISHAEIIYLSVDPYIRARRSYTIWNKGKENLKEPNCKLTYKGTGTMCREEVETPIELQFFLMMKQLLGVAPIIKEHNVYSIDGQDEPLVIMDVDRGTPTAFSYAELEFETEELARTFEFPWPEIVERDVTEDPYYKMNHYWKRTRLDGTRAASNGCEAMSMDVD